MDKTLNKEMTELVVKYIGEGYVINGKTMSGSDGTERVDLVKGNNFIRVWKEHKLLRRSEDGFYGDAIVLRSGSYKLKKKNTDIVWANDLKTEYEKKYYVLGDYYRNYTLTESADECRKARELGMSRLMANDVKAKKYTDANRLRIGFKAVKKQPRTKCVHLEDMRYLEKYMDGYRAWYETKSGLHNVWIG